MRLTSIFTLLSAAMAFTASGVSITVNVTVDSHIVSATVKTGDQSMAVAANGSATWIGWTVDADYAPTFSGVADGYTGKWRVTADGAEELSGGASDAITLSQSYAGCTLSFYGEPNTYTITLDRQSGSGGTASTVATYASPMPSITPPTRPGYEFCAYTNNVGTKYYNADGTSARTWDNISGATLYAQWKAVAFDVTLDRQLGINGTRTVVATYGEAMPPITLPTRTGYEFRSYATAPNGGGTKYYNADGTSANPWNETSATTLYAQWAVISSTVTLNPQGGTGGSTSVKATYASPMPKIDLPKRANYEFRSYTAAPDGGGTRYYNAKGASARKWDQTTNTVLYAQWIEIPAPPSPPPETPTTYTVTLDPQGGSNGTESVTATYGEAMPAITPPTRTGYEFCSYTNDVGISYYNADGSSATNWNVASDATLYASWSPVRVPGNLAVAVDATNLEFTTFGTVGPQGQPNEAQTNYEWFAQTDFAYYGGSAAQSHALPVSSSDYQVYCSWLTTTVEGKGVLSFWWKCAAKQRQSYSSGTGYKTYGDIFRFGTCDGDYFDQADELEGSTDWMHVAYTNNTEGKVTLAWVFTYADYAGRVTSNGGGTGWVDRVEWTPLPDEPPEEPEPPSTYTVNFNPNAADATGDMEPMPCTYDVPANLTPCAFTRTGYTFAGWSTNAAAEAISYTNCAEVVNLATGGVFTLYAKWVEDTPAPPVIDPVETQKVWTVTFDAQDGTMAEVDVKRSITNGCAVGELPTVTRTGYRGGDWYTESEGGSKVAASTVITNDVKFYAHWTAETFTVYFYWNHFADDTRGGNNKWTYGSDLSSTLPPAARERDGYGFLGYFTAREGGTQYVYADGTSVQWNIPSNTILYAHWKPIQYSISFNTNAVGVTNTMKPVVCTYDVPTNLTPCAFQRTGYDFAGWTNSEGKVFADRALVTNLTAVSDMEVPLYAMWTAKTYMVNFDNGSTSTSITYGAPIEIPKRPGYAFGGYFTQSDGQGTKCYNADGSMESVDEATISNAKLYAHWIPDAYIVKFDANDGEGGWSSNLTCGATFTAPTVTREGYTFTGWSPEVPGTVPASNATYTAQWAANQYTVTFAANAADATGNMEPMSCTYDAPANLAPCAFQRTGYGFAGWTNGVGEAFADGATVSNLTATANGTVTLYAQWVETGYTVSLDAGDGVGFMTNSAGEEVSVITDFAVTIGGAWNLPTAVTNVNPALAFAGWAYVKEGVTNALPEVVPSLSDGVTNLVATWGDALAVALDAPGMVFSTKGTVANGVNLRFDDKDYDAKWFAQTGCGKVSGTSAAQSGVLPKTGNEAKVYVSWLTTTVEGNGVLSFWWRCAAQPLQEVGGDSVGDMFKFGTVSDNQFTELPEVPQLTGDFGWRSVEYTNTVNGSVTFAWAFTYTDGTDNGGGTGWVDRVEWKPLDNN